MNYKKLIPSQNLRLQLLKITEFVPDKIMIHMQFFIKIGKRLDLRTPQTFNEKIQAYKLYHRDKLMTVCADKYRVREFIEEKDLGKILIPLYGVYDCAEEINFDELPNRFVLKINNGSGTNIICKDKRDLDIELTKKTLNDWRNNRTTKAGREWAYYNIEPKIICEKYIESSSGLIDYKFYCFNGEPKYIKVSLNSTQKNEVQKSFYDMDFVNLPYKAKSAPLIDYTVDKPQNFEEMINICKTISQNFPHVRIDLYNIDGKIYFGECTFYDNSGYDPFVPDKFDFILGENFDRF